MTRGSRAASALVCCGAALAAAPAPVAAQERPARPGFERAYQAGLDAYHLGRFDEARVRFEDARRAAPDLPGPHRQLAAVAFAQRRFRDCLASAATALRIKPDSDVAGKVRELHAECRRQLGRLDPDGRLEEEQGAVSVTANVADAVVLVNGLTVGPTPLAPRPTATGKVMVEVRKAGYIEVHRKVEILPGIVTDVDVRLARDPRHRRVAIASARPGGVGWLRLVGAPKGAQPRVRIDGATPGGDARGRLEIGPGIHELTVDAGGYEPWRRRVQIADGQVTTVELDLASRSATRRQRLLAWSALGVAGLAAGTGFALTVAEMRTFEEAQDIHDRERTRPTDVPLDDSADLASVGTRAEIDRLRDRGGRLALGAAVSYGVSVVALGASVYYFIRSRRGDRPGMPPPFAAVPVEGGVTLTSELRW